MKLEKLIGKGTYRRVYEHPDDNTLVVKVLRKNKKTNKSNEIEWKIWNAIKDTEYAEYFCPCIELTKEGYLIMNRCDPIEDTIEGHKTVYVLGIPIIESHRWKNKGILDDRVVVLDFGNPQNLDLLDVLLTKQ
jgi:hypothetical protein